MERAAPARCERAAVPAPSSPSAGQARPLPIPIARRAGGVRSTQGPRGRSGAGRPRAGVEAELSAGAERGGARPGPARRSTALNPRFRSPRRGRSVRASLRLGAAGTVRKNR